MKRTTAALTLTIALFGAACSSAETAAPTSAPRTTTTTTVTAAPPTTATISAPAAATTTAPTSPLAGLVAEIGSAEYDPAEHRNDLPAPNSISISRIGVSNATVVDVGVEDNGDMEIPESDAVGWYRFNPTPGENGSAVLAAHISFNGANGVFRYLSDVEPGDVVTIGYDDGSSGTFEVFEVSQYDKQELPLDRIFDKDGDPVLTLITCGGDFNRSVSSYEDNFVAYAIPIDSGT